MRERSLEFAELDEMFERVTAHLTSDELAAMKEVDLVPYWEQAEAMLSPQTRERLGRTDSSKAPR